MMRRFFLTLILIVLPLACSTAIAESKLADVKSQGRISRRMRKFFKEGYRPPRQIDEESRKMTALVNKLNSISLSREKLQQIQNAENAEKNLEPAPTTQPAPKAKPTPANPRTPLSKELLRKLRKQAGDEVANPIRLADALYESGHKAEAYDIYNMSLQQSPSANDTDWILFQMANCQIETKPAEARKLMQKLMKEHPNSPWSMLAENQELMLEWMENSSPKKVLNLSRKILNKKI